MEHLNKKLTDGETDAHETFIPCSSSLIGKKISEVMRKYLGKLRIDHYHDAPDCMGEEHKITPDTILRRSMSLQFYGEWKDICEFTRQYGLA